MDFEKVRKTVEEYTSGICSEVYAPASHLPERVVDWIAQAFIDDYILDDDEDMVPDYNAVLRGMCDYLQEECSEDAHYLFEKQRKIDEIKVTLDSMGYDVNKFTESDLLEIYDSAYEALSNDDEYNSAYSEAVSAATEEFLNKQFECPLGGDETNDCADCAYSGDYHFLNGECVRRGATVRYYVRGLGYDKNNCVTDNRWDFGDFDIYDDAYKLFSHLHSKDKSSFFKGSNSNVSKMLLRVEKCTENNDSVECIDVMNADWIKNPKFEEENKC